MLDFRSAIALVSGDGGRGSRGLSSGDEYSPPDSAATGKPAEGAAQAVAVATFTGLPDRFERR
jgi:hypothetical protein